MIPQEILSQLPDGLSKEKLRSLRLSTSPGSSFGESYLISHNDDFWFFTRSSMLDPFAKHAASQRPTLTKEGSDSFLFFMADNPIKIKLSFFEERDVAALLSSDAGAAQAATTGLMDLAPPPSLARELPAPPVSVLESAPPPSVTTPTATPIEAPEPIKKATGLTEEEIVELRESLESDVVERLEDGNFEGARQRLQEICKLDIKDTDDLEHYARGVLSIEALEQGKPRDAFFLAGDYDRFYLDFQESLCLLLAEKLVALGEKRLAAAAYFAALEEDEANKLIAGEGLTEDSLPAVIYQEALPFLQEYMQKNPTRQEVMPYLTNILSELERYEEELVIAKRNIALAPQSESGYSAAVDAASELERLDEALSFAKDAIAKNPKAPWAFSLAGEVYAARDEFSQSRSSFESALKLNPGDFSALHGLPKILRSQKDHRALAALLESSVEEHLEYKKKETYEELAQLYEGPLQDSKRASHFRAKAGQTTSYISPKKSSSGGVFWFLVLGAALFYWLILAR